MIAFEGECESARLRQLRTIIARGESDQSRHSYSVTRASCYLAWARALCSDCGFGGCHMKTRLRGREGVALLLL